MIRLSRLAALSALAALAGCASTPAPAPAPVVSAPVLAVVGTVARAEAALAPASASIASGRLVLVAEPGGVRISGTLGGLRPGLPAAFHVHERGDCSAVDASSAGGHFNPLGQPHGRSGSAAHHLGDMDNLQVDSQGRAAVDVLLPGVVLGGGAANDIIGRALVVHGQADDYHSAPAGNAGPRVACGVIRALS